MMALAAAQTSFISTALVGLVVLMIVALILRSMYKKKKRTGTFIGCDCGCQGCACSGACHGGCSCAGKAHSEK